MNPLDPTEAFDTLTSRSQRRPEEDAPWLASWWSSGAERHVAPGFDPDPERRGRRAWARRA